MFAASGVDLFDVHRLGRPIRSEVTIDDSPFIEPLTAMPGDDGYCVLLINRQLARILVGGGDGMREVVSIVDDVHRWHDQGGWSQARFQRGIQKETKDHLKHAGDELFKLFKRGLVHRLIIGRPEEMRGEVEGTLHSYLRDRIAGWLDIDVRAPPAEVAREAAAIIERGRARARARVARPPEERAGPQRARRRGPGRHARGAERAPGRGAARAGRASAPGLRDARTPTSSPTEPGSSPTGEELQKRDDVIESAIECALEQSAEVVVVRHHPDLEALGSIGAVLRY